MPFAIETTRISGVTIVTPSVVEDERGFFLEAYKQSSFRDFGIDQVFVQENHSRSARGTLRGLHFQREPMAQGKLVRVTAGEIFDVTVDIRDGSPTFRAWVGVRLSAENHRAVYVPPGCAHGFCVLSPSADVTYLTTREYSAEHEGGLLWNDPALGIDWPVTDPLVSARDRNWLAIGPSRSC